MRRFQTTLFSGECARKALQNMTKAALRMLVAAIWLSLDCLRFYVLWKVEKLVGFSRKSSHWAAAKKWSHRPFGVCSSRVEVLTVQLLKEHFPKTINLTHLSYRYLFGFYFDQKYLIQNDRNQCELKENLLLSSASSN